MNVTVFVFRLVQVHALLWRSRGRSLSSGCSSRWRWSGRGWRPAAGWAGLGVPLGGALPGSAGRGSCGGHPQLQKTAPTTAARPRNSTASHRRNDFDSVPWGKSEPLGTNEKRPTWVTTPPTATAVDAGDCSHCRGRDWGFLLRLSVHPMQRLSSMYSIDTWDTMSQTAHRETRQEVVTLSLFISHNVRKKIKLAGFPLKVKNICRYNCK